MLNQTQKQDLVAALKAGFPTKAGLERVLFLGLGKSFVGLGLDEGEPGRILAPKLVELAERDGWIADLIEAAVRENPTNEQLGQFYKEWKQS